MDSGFFAQGRELSMLHLFTEIHTVTRDDILSGGYGCQKYFVKIT